MMPYSEQENADFLAEVARHPYVPEVEPDGFFAGIADNIAKGDAALTQERAQLSDTALDASAETGKGLVAGAYAGVGAGAFLGLEAARGVGLIASSDQERQADLAYLKSLRPDPHVTGWLGQAAFGLGKVGTSALLGSLAGGAAGGAALVGATEFYEDFRFKESEGVDTSTAAKTAAITGVTTAVGTMVPGGAGVSLMERIASGALINIDLGMFQRGTTEQILRENGYDGMAEQYKALDGMAVFSDAVLGGAFGVLSKLHDPVSPKMTIEPATGKPIQDAEFTVVGEEPQLAAPQKLLTAPDDAAPPQARPSAETPETIILPSDIDAALAANNIHHLEIDSAPGIPADIKTRNAHVQAMDTATQQLMRGDPVDLGGILDDATFVPRPPHVETQAAIQEFVDEQAQQTDEPFVGEVIEVKNKPYRKPSDPKRPLGVLEYIAKNGGIKDPGGDLKAMGLDKKFLPRYGKLVRKGGVNPDDMVLKAWEEGYFPHSTTSGERPTINDLYDLMSKEHISGRQVTIEDINAQQDAAALKRLENEMADIERAALHYDITTEGKTRDQLVEEIQRHEASDFAAHDFLDEIDAEERLALQGHYGDDIQDILKGEPHDDIPFDDAATPRGLVQQDQQRQAAIGENAQDGEGGGGRSAEGATERVTLDGQQYEQGVMPGMQRSARQAAAAREDKFLGRKGTTTGQKAADEGLFAMRGDEPQLFDLAQQITDDVPDMKIVDENGSVIDAAEAMRKADAEIAKAEQEGRAFDAAIDCFLRFGE